MTRDDDGFKHDDGFTTMSDIGIFGASEATSKPLPGLARRTSLSAAGSVVLAPPGARGSKLAALKAAFKQQRAGSDALRGVS